MNSNSELSGEKILNVVDVRTPAEFAAGHVAGSLNIPLNELPGRINELKGLSNIILCCASGARSGIAAAILKQNQIECKNGGAWTDVNYSISMNYYDRLI